MNLIATILTTVLATSSSQQADTSAYMQYVDSADYYLAQSRWLDAERMLTSALRTDPANAGNMLLLSNLGIARTQTGNIPGALEAFDIGLARAPRSSVLLTNRAIARIEAGDTDGAIEDLTLSLNTDSTQQRALETRGMLLLSRQDFNRAIDDFRSLMRQYPANAAAPAGIAQCHAANGQYTEAVRMLEKAIAIDSDESYHFLLILYNIEAGNLLEATDAAREALQLFPKSGRLYLLRAVLHKRHFQLTEADAAIKLAKQFGVNQELLNEFFPKQ